MKWRKSPEIIFSTAGDVSLVSIRPESVISTFQVLAAGQSRQRWEVLDTIADRAGIDDEARAETLKSGGTRYEQRMDWVLSHLREAKWVDRRERGCCVITDAGSAALAHYPQGLD